VKKEKKREKEHRVVKKTSEHKIFIVILAIIVFLIFLSYFFKGFMYNLVNNDLDNIIHFIYYFGGFSFFIFIILIIFEVVLAPVPGLILNVAGGWVFGPVLGSILVLIGNLIGATICYFIAKRLGGTYFKKLIGKEKLKKFTKYVDKDGFLVLFILRLNPLTSSDIFSYVAGLVNMKYKPFILSTTFGLAPLVFILSYSGDYFIGNSIFFRLIFFIISILYFAVFFYGLYRIGKNGLKNKIKKRKKKK